MIDEDVKKELVQSINTLISSTVYDNKTYIIKARRQDQPIMLEKPNVLIAFMESVPQKGLLGNRIGTYTTPEGNNLQLRGWPAKQRIVFQIRARNDPDLGIASAEPFVSVLANRIYNHVFNNWDSILYPRYMSLDEPFSSIKYISEKVGPEYGYVATFEASITYNQYFPMFSAPSDNSWAVQFEIGLQEINEEGIPEFVLIPENP